MFLFAKEYLHFIFFSQCMQPAAYPPLNWEDTLNATNYGPLCLQINFTTGLVEGDEDCLRINVFTPNVSEIIKRYWPYY